ncbi:metal-dependent hydrolase [Acuticoccus kandeliae]|uniref:metal-dependent hydrolase n=1 Tax=Acuticoccus kandeliae TaxID=2073160 RepID=UPI000D3E6303|nr:metal-dependent hydrolase [Acuticoccus kandeliae]
MIIRWLVLTLLLVIAPLRAAAQPVEVLWLGHSTTRLTSVSGKVILIDPFLTRNPVTPPEYRDLNAVGDVDLILVTHGHQDHVSDLLELSRLTGAKILANYEFARNLVALGLVDENSVISMNKGGAVEPLGRGVKIHMVHADHSSSLDYNILGIRSPDANASVRQGGGAGVPVGFVIEMENGFTIYHTGDTAVFGDMALIRELYAPDLALVCIGGFFTMGPTEAAYAVRELIKPKAVIPIHYGTFPVLNRTPAEMKDALGDTDIEMLDVVPGQAILFEGSSPVR